MQVGEFSHMAPLSANHTGDQSANHTGTGIIVSLHLRLLRTYMYIVERSWLGLKVYADFTVPSDIAAGRMSVTEQRTAVTPFYRTVCHRDLF